MRLVAISPSVRCGFTSGVVLALAALLCGFTPLECSPKHAASDPEKAEVIAIGRVIGISRFDEKGIFCYEVTFKIGRLLRGQNIEVVKFVDGMYRQDKEDNTVPTQAGVGFTMSPMVCINGVYLIYFTKDGDRYRPRSYHYSVCRIQEFVSEPENSRSIGLLEPIGNQEVREWGSLDDYLKAKRLM